MEDKQARKIPKHIIISIALTCACIVFGVLCVHKTAIGFISRNVTLFSWLLSAFFIGICALCVLFGIKGRDTLSKTAITLLVFLLFCLVVLFVLQTTGFFEVIKDEKSLQAYLEKAGAWMPAVYIVLQYLQVVVLPIPSVMSTLAGVALFGAWRTLIYSYVGIWLGSVTAFFIGRKLGYKAVAWIVGEDTLKKWRKKLKGKDNLLLTLMFFLPVFPDDVLCFVAGLSSMTNRYFLIMMSVSRAVGISATCFSFEFIPFTTWWGLLIWGIFIVGFILAFWFIHKHLDALNAWFSKRRTKRKSKKGERKAEQSPKENA